MSGPDPLRRLRSGLERVADADADADANANAAPRRSRRLRWVALGAVPLLGAGGVAVGSELIGVGVPEVDQAGKVERYRPVANGRLDATAADTPLPWGVEVYTGRDGAPCALVGQLRRGALGVVRDGTFRPYARRAADACGDLARQPFFLGQRTFPGRSVVYGRARPGVAGVELTSDGIRERATPGPRGAFVFVLRGDVRLDRLRVGVVMR